MAQELVTGMARRGDVVEWTTLRVRKGQPDVVDRGEAAWSGGDLFSEEASAWWAEVAPRVRGRVSWALPAGEVLMQVLDLPSTDPAEVASMVELQVDKFSPFPVDQMQVSWEALRTRGATTRALVAALRRDRVEQIGSVMGKAGLRPHSLDVDLLGWWRLVRAAGAVQGEGGELLIRLSPEATDLIVVQDGAPLAFRGLSVAQGASEGARVADTAEEVRYTLATLEAQWGTAGVGRLVAWVERGVSRELAEGLGAACGLPTEVREGEELPALSEGVALRASEAGMGQMNLAPAAWREEEESRKFWRSLAAVVGAFLMVWAAGVGALVMGLKVQAARLEKLRAEEQRLAAPAQEVRQLQQSVRGLEQYADRSHSALECLREVSAVLPRGIDLTSFVYRKGRAVNLRGEADRVEPIYAFLEALQNTGFFAGVKTEGVADKRRGSVVKSEFRIVANLPGEGS